MPNKVISNFLLILLLNSGFLGYKIQSKLTQGNLLLDKSDKMICKKNNFSDEFEALLNYSEIIINEYHDFLESSEKQNSLHKIMEELSSNSYHQVKGFTFLK